MVSLAIACLLIPNYAGASTVVFETTGWIDETTGSGLTFDFVADTAPLTYMATLSDLSEAPYFGFDFLYLSITTSTGTLGSIVGPGSFTFEAVEGLTTYFVNVFGTPDGTTEAGAGLFGVEVTAIPIPSGLILLGTSVFGLIILRRRVR